MDGAMKVTTEPGRGSTFTVSCKCKPLIETSVDVNVNSPEAVPRSGRVLIVDDNEVNIKVLSRMLRGIPTAIARNGQEAVRFMEEHGSEICMILMDIQMPIMNGYEATHEIRRQGWTLPIIAVTANAPDDLTWRSCGMNEYIQKPLYRDILTNLLAKYSITLGVT